jgi:hypothetical protein
MQPGWLFAFGLARGWWGVGFGIGDVEANLAALGRFGRVHELADGADDGGELFVVQNERPFQGRVCRGNPGDPGNPGLRPGLVERALQARRRARWARERMLSR